MPASPVQAIKNAPVTTLSTAEALVGATLTFLVTHHVIGDVDVSATTQTVAPFVALALPAAFGALKWRLVSPYAKVKELAERDGVVSDADFARLDALLDDKLREWGLVADDEIDEADDAEYSDGGEYPDEGATDTDTDTDTDTEAGSDSEDPYVPEHSEAGLRG